MNKIKIILFAFTLLLVNKINAQTAAANCNSVTCTGVPAYNLNLYKIPPNWPGCTMNVTAADQKLRAIFTLQQKQSNGGWANVYGLNGGQSSPNFYNLTHGTYRVKIDLPQYAMGPAACGFQAIKCINILNVEVGRGGVFGLGSSSFTNEVIVGQTVTADNVYTFSDLNGTNNNALGFDANENVFINCSQMKNYNTYFMAIFENGGLNRYKSTNWVNGLLPNSFNLSQWWAENPGWTFIPLQSYTIQMVNINSSCGGNWNVVDKTFFICPNGSGCKQSDFVKNGITISNLPNGFILNNMDLSKQNNIKVFSLDGRLVKEYNTVSKNQFSTTDYTNGLYVVTLTTDNKKSFTGKIQVNN
jgi:hypothetical protein